MECRDERPFAEEVRAPGAESDEAWGIAERGDWERELAGHGASPVGESAEARSERLRVERCSVLGDDPETVVRRAETWVGWIPQHVDGQWRIEEGAARRKRSGSFYTPRELSFPLVERVLRPLLVDTSGRPKRPAVIAGLRVCDPACGAGRFLLDALDVLTVGLEAAVEEHGLDGLESDRAARRRRLAADCVYGVDRDRGAAAAARRVLSLASGVEESELRVRVGDSLVGHWSGVDRELSPDALERHGGDERDEGPTRRRRARAIGIFRTRFLRGESHGSVRLPEPADEIDAADRSVAWWFWPASRLADAPLSDGSVADPDRARAIYADLAAELRPFHWRLVFPEVAHGFDAVVGNPPWETVKGEAADFFADVAPDYAELGAPEARRRRRLLFDADPALEDRWIGGRERTKAYANWFARVGDSEPARARNRPFQHRGRGDLNGWKLFLELALALVRSGGRLGLVVPASLASDRGADALRRMLLDRTSWEWFWTFENRTGIFPIHRSFKFGCVVAEAGSSTESLSARFQDTDLDRWSDMQSPAALEFSRATIHALSPSSEALCEVDSRDELALLEQLVAEGEPLRASALGLRFSTELHTSHDAAYFERREAVEARGAEQVEDGSWVEARWRREPAPEGVPVSWTADRRMWADPDEIRARHLPVIQGAMLAAHDGNAARHCGGHGRAARFEAQAGFGALPRPQYVAEEGVLDRWERLRPGPKVAHRRIAPSSNARTMIAAVLGRWPTLDSLFLYSADPDDARGLEKSLVLTALLGSFVVDWQIRRRTVGVNLSQFVVEELRLPRGPELERQFARLAELAARLGLVGNVGLDGVDGAEPWLERAQTAPLVTAEERRLALAEIDARVALAFGLDPQSFARMFTDCVHPAEDLSRVAYRRRLPLKGFWRVDRDLPPDQRAPALALRTHASLWAETRG
ncbi:MAG: N-6 DNA methylase [Planctomycetota bacterium]|jgi:hypothetical protein